MERLTIRMDHGIVMNDGYDFGIDPDDYDLVQKILAKLAEYEDSGYDPAEYARQLRAAAKTAEGWFAECKEKEAEAAALKKQHDGVAEAFRLLTERFESVCAELEQYKNLGMTPEQIRNAQDTLQCFDNIGIKRGNEIVKAEEDGRLVVLDEALRPLIWGDADHDTILCPRCLNDLMGGFDFAPDADTKMFQCPYCGCPVDPTRVDPFAEDADVLTNEAVTDINVGDKKEAAE